MRRRIIFVFSFLLVLSALIGIVVSASYKEEEPEEDITYLTSGESDIFLESGLFTQEDDLTVYNQGEIDYTDFEFKIQNDKLALYTNPDTGAIRLLNKETGFVWASDILDA